MTEEHRVFQPKYLEGLLGAISAGFFLIVIGAFFVVTPNLFDKILDFFKDFDIARLPNSSIIYWPAPARPWAHTVLYSVVTHFCLVWGIFQIIILAMRFFASSPLSKKAETASNIVFWLGAFYLGNRFLTSTTTLETWFVFWATIIMLAGVSLIIRAAVLATKSFTQ